MDAGLLLFSLFAFYLYISFIVYIWSSVHSLSFIKVFSQPLTYWKLTDFKWSNILMYIFFPWFFILGMTVSIAIIFPMIGGYYKVGGELYLKWNWVYIAFLSVPVIGSFFVFRSLSKVRCVVCRGKKYVDKGFNDLIDLHYSKKTKCFCCHGKGHIKIDSTLGRTHLVLEQNIELMREHEHKYLKHERNIKRLQRQVDEGRSRSSEALLDKITAKYKFYKEVFDFYDKQ